MTEDQKCILYVDDDPDDREFLSEAIRNIDPKINVIPAENGLKALKYLDEAKHSTLPCAIVLDLNMPFLDGKETLHRIKMDSALHEVPVIILSSSENPTDRAFFDSQGIKYFSKPTNISFLSDIANHLLSNYCQRAV